MDLLSYMMGRKSAGGGGGGSDANIEVDFTNLGTKTLNGVDYSPAGATFNSTSDYISIGHFINLAKDSNGVTIELDVASMPLSRGSNKRFIMGNSSTGLLYRASGTWSFYNSSWEDGTFEGATDGSFFSDCTIKIYIDSSNKWHIYKDDVLVFEPSLAQAISLTGAYIGSTSDSINNAVFTALRLYGGQH